MKRLLKVLQRNSLQQTLAVFLCAALLAPFNAALYAQDQPAQDSASPGSASGTDFDARSTQRPGSSGGALSRSAAQPGARREHLSFGSGAGVSMMQKNPSLTGTALTEAVQQQNWDPSIQALNGFPDVIKRLNDDVTWTTNLGNAFLAQQPDVMDAVQRMRAQAQQARKLASSPQETVTTQSDNGQNYIDIEPANPDVIYVPVYDPAWIWGPPIWYPYPHWYWPGRSVIYGGLGFGFGVGISIGGFFGGGWGGWGGWGWHPSWGSHTVIVAQHFIHRYNFNTVNVRNVHGGAGVWEHDAVHR